MLGEKQDSIEYFLLMESFLFFILLVSVDKEHWENFFALLHRLAFHRILWRLFCTEICNFCTDIVVISVYEYGYGFMSLEGLSSRELVFCFS